MHNKWQKNAKAQKLLECLVWLKTGKWERKGGGDSLPVLGL
jgi:hypothetical protein